MTAGSRTASRLMLDRSPGSRPLTIELKSLDVPGWSPARGYDTSPQCQRPYVALGQQMPRQLSSDSGSLLRLTLNRCSHLITSR